MAPCGIGKKFIAELLGTFFLVFFGTGSAVITLMISESVNPNNVGIGILGGLGDWIAIALAFGLTVMVCIYLFGRISGAHLNPAVTVGLLVSKNISLADSVYYIVAQVIGACCGSLALVLCLGMPSVVVGGLGATAPGMGVSYLQTIFAEFIGTFFLVLVIMGVAVDKKATPNFAGLSIYSNCSYYFFRAIYWRFYKSGTYICSLFDGLFGWWNKSLDVFPNLFNGSNCRSYCCSIAIYLSG